MVDFIDILPKIYKRLHILPCRLVISNTWFYAENISRSLNFDLKPITAKVESYIKDNDDFLTKLWNLSNLPNHVIVL